MKIKDIEFNSADHVIKEIEDMNVKGGSPFGRSAAWAFKLISLQETFDTKEELIARYKEVASKMYSLKPTMATISNVSTIVNRIIENNNLTSDELKKEIIKVCDDIIDYSFSSVDKLSLYGANIIQEGDVVMMHSYSSTLMGIFIQAKKDGKNFEVICTESRPLRESREAIKVLQKLKVPVTLITDASIYEFLPKCNFVIMGADTLSVNGDVANKMGTALVAKLAQNCKKPVYIASELFKLDINTQYGNKIELERRTKFEIIAENDFETLEGLTVINQFFDLTPARDIDAIICEFGVIPPNLMITFWKELESILVGGIY